MSNMSTYLVNGLNMEKFAAGPTIPKPGPILLMVAATAVKVVTRSVSSKDTSSTDAENTIANVIKYTFTALTTSCSTGLSSIFDALRMDVGIKLLDQGLYEHDKSRNLYTTSGTACTGADEHKEHQHHLACV